MSQDSIHYSAAHSGVALKPRFVLKPDGSLALLPRPTLKPSDYDAYIADPSRFLEADAFLPGTGNHAAKWKPGIPRTLNVIRALQHPRLWSLATDASWYNPFFQPGREDQSLELTLEIIERFATNAKARGQTGSVLIIPSARDMRFFLSEGRWAHQPLVDALRQRGIAVHDAGAPLVARLQGGTPCSLYCTGAIRQGHYNAQGNVALAQWMAEQMRVTLH